MRRRGIATLVLVFLSACAQVPESVPKIVAVSIEAPGLTEEQTEQAVAEPFEQALLTVQGVQRIRSSITSGGFCRIEVEFESTPNQQMLQLVQSAALAVWQQSAVRMAAPIVAIQDRRSP